jgi:hypothetical protein
MKLKLGRLPRKHDDNVKMMAHLMRRLPIPASKYDWTKGQTQFGMMLNDSLGDCTCAAVYHAKQIWSLNASKEDTQPDSSVLSLYEKACGYVPGEPSTDQGGVEQNVLNYLKSVGIPLVNGQADKIIGYIECNPRNIDEVKLSVQDFGLSYIGFDVPANIFAADGTPNDIWQYEPGASIEGGHAVIIVAYDPNYLTVVSWGGLYKMTYEFFVNYCDESYAIIAKDWFNKIGKTPLGMSEPQLAALLSSF